MVSHYPQGYNSMRFYDAATVNEIANIPDVSRGISLDGEVTTYDFSAAIGNIQNVFLHARGCVAICEWSAPRVYQCHLLSRPESRGRNAIAMFRAMADYMLMFHADMLWGQPRISDRPARWLIRQLGFSPAGFGTNGIVGPVEYFQRGAICHQQ